MRAGRLVALLIALATAAALVPSRPDSDAQTTLTMTVWGMPFEDALFRDGYARGFEARHPEIRVDYQRYGPDLVHKYYAWNLLGRSADVMRIQITDYHALVARGVIEPLDPWINHPDFGLSQADRDDFVPSIWNRIDIDGRRYALPADNAQYGLYYNRAIFDAYNAAHPDRPIEYPHADWTWADLLDASRRLTVVDETGATVQYGIGFHLWSWPFMAFFSQAGGDLWNDDHTITSIDSPEGVEALEFLLQLIPPDAPARLHDMRGTGTGPDKQFALGRQAMLLDGSWRAPNLELVNPDLDFAIAPLPHHRERAVVCGSVLWAVGAHSRHKEWAWRMIRWMTNREQSLRYWDALRVAPPARVSVIESEAFRQSRGIVEDGNVRVPPMPQDRYNARAAWLSYAITPHPQTGKAPGFVPMGPYQADLESAITTALVAAVRGDKTAEEALRDAAREVHAIIDRDRATRGLPPVRRD